MLSFTGATGNLFTRFGKLGLVIKAMKSYQGSQLTNFTDTVNGVVAQFNSESDIQALMGSSYIGILSSIDGSVAGLMQNIASQTIQRMVFRDNPQFNQNLTTGTNLVCITEVIRQMKLEGAAILRMTVGATPTVGPNPPSSFTGTGNGVIIASIVRPFDGNPLENAYAENLKFICTSDSYVGGATAGNEGFVVTGPGSETDVFAFDWPLGSNGSTTLSATDGNQNVSSNNLLTNSGFSTFANIPNVPDNFTLVKGTAGVNTFQESTLTYGSSGSALRIQGDGTTLVTLQQNFGSGSGTSGTLSPLTQYSVNVWMRRDGVSPTGQLSFSLVDGNNNIINDQAGTPNTFTVNLASLSTSYLAYNGVFRTPWILPSTYGLKFYMPVGQALTNGRSIYLDKLGLGIMSQVYTGGPFVAVHSGSTPFIQGDYGFVAVTNSRGSGGTLSTFQTLLFQLFSSDAIANEILWPSSFSPTVQDSLIG